jgi:putative ABC transport system ATP-binding protein
VIVAQGLYKRYRMGHVAVDALRGVDLVVRKGEFVAVMGPSGSGKSTLLHLLGGLDAPSEGEVTLGGRRLITMRDDEVTVIRRRQVGFVFQFYNLLPTLSAAENVALPLLLDGQDRGTCASRVDEMLALVGLSERGEHRPDQLSGGEQQRVAIARALVTHPLLVLADEPTGNLDRTAGSEVLALLRRACDEWGQTIVMVTHDPYAASHADRVIVLRDGQVVRTWQPADGDGDRVQAIADLVAELEL